MMEHEFSQAMSRLINVYGDRAYPAERTKIIWQKVAPRHVFVFEKAIERCIAEYMQPPMLEKILKAVYEVETEFPEYRFDPFKESRKAIEEIRASSPLCELCLNTGIIDGLRKDILESGQTHFACTCSVGDMLKRLPEGRGTHEWQSHFKYYYLTHRDWLFRFDDLDRYKHTAGMEEPAKYLELKRLYEIRGNGPMPEPPQPDFGDIADFFGIDPDDIDPTRSPGLRRLEVVKP